MTARAVEVVDGEVVALEVHDDRLSGVRLAEGTVVALDALAVASRVAVRDELLGGLGVATAQHPSGMGQHVPADSMGRTDVEGVWVAGTVTDPSAQVIVAAAQGNRWDAFYAGNGDGATLWSGSPTAASSPRSATSHRAGRWTSGVERERTRSGSHTEDGRSRPSTRRLWPSIVPRPLPPRRRPRSCGCTVG